MVEVGLQSFGGSVTASAPPAVDQEGRLQSQNVNVIEELTAELQREKQRNAQLLQRISMLEAQVQQRHKESSAQKRQGSPPLVLGLGAKKLKRQKVEELYDRIEGITEHMPESGSVVQTTDGSLPMFPKEEDHDNMSIEGSHSLNLKGGARCLDFENDGLNDCDGEDCYDEEDVGVIPHRNELKKQEMNENKVATKKDISVRRPLKVPFCPKEVKRIVESEVLLHRNAESHTMRKIIVFASLGIKHGFEDLYELDINHFSILRKGEPYISQSNPGEHVLYENPGVRRKIFYANRENPVLCPVKVLEEERAMRPSDSSCPSCLFLCIKYGGSTRNLPQNEYVRQQMGRNKLKSFGPLMCRMAMLVHIRGGSFFFRALGITLLFIAGASHDLVQKETKYMNLDLLQKYYRADEDAEGEDLFLQQPRTSPPASRHSCKLTGKKSSTKLKTKDQAHAHNMPENLGSSSRKDSHSSGTPSPLLVSAGYSSYHSQAPYHIFLPQPANAFYPVMFWPPPNTFSTRSGPFKCNDRGIPSDINCFSVHPHPYYSYPNPIPMGLVPDMVNGTEKKNEPDIRETDGNLHSSSSST